MDKSKEIEENVLNYDTSKYRTPDGAPADNILFTITTKDSNNKVLPEKKLKVLMIRRKKWPYAGSWALPGGFSNPNETLLDAAKRELKEETGVEGIHVDHLGVYDTPGRDPRGWIISSAYTALVNERFLEHRKAADDAADERLFDILEILLMNQGDPEASFEENENSIAFDHRQIINDALKKIENQILTTTIAKEFLPKEFTLTELYQIIQAVVLEFNEPLPNFRRKILASQNKLGIIVETFNENGQPKTTTRYSQRPAQLYEFTGFVPKLVIF